MAKIKVSIWFDSTGEIVAIGRSMGQRTAVALGSDDVGTLDTEIDEGEIASLPQTSQVDVMRKEIVRRFSYDSTHGPHRGTSTRRLGHPRLWQRYGRLHAAPLRCSG
jgi:hypothetical protein